MIFQDLTPDATGVLVNMLEAYGPTGAAFGALLMMLVRSNKKCEEKNNQLESKIDQNESNHRERLDRLEIRHLEEHKEMIKDYNHALHENGSVISKLTSCLTAIKDTLERIDRRTEKQD
jgi:predicted RNase H-like nuclease (RuvC/YqgF family)